MPKKKKVRESARVPKQVAKLIPYASVIKGRDIIEAEPGVFSCVFSIDDSRFVFDTEKKSKMFGNFAYLVDTVDETADFQFFSRREGDIIEKYLAYSVRASSVEEAEERFDEIRSNFTACCREAEMSIRITRLPATDILELIYEIYHGNSNYGFLNKIGGQDITAETMRKYKLTTKDVVGPGSLHFDRDYIKTDDGYIRVLFINSFADHVAAGFLSAIIDAKGEMMTSVHYHPVDPEPLLEKIENEIAAAKEAAKKKKKAPGKQQKGSSPMQKVKDQKSEVANYPNNEEIQIKESYTAMLKDAVDRGNRLFQISFLFALFAPTLDELNEETERFTKENGGFFFRILPLDYQQKQALASIMPLANNKLSVARTFTAHSAGITFPFILGGCDSLPKTEINRISSQMDFYTIKTKIDKPRMGDQFKVKKTIQETIPYLAAYEDFGIFESVPGAYSRMYAFTDINYHTATEEDQTNFLIKYSQLLNRFDTSIKCQIVLNNKNVDLKRFEEDNLLKLKGDELDIYRKEYNTIVTSKMEEGRNNLRKERYMVLSIEAENYDAAKHAFNRLDPEIVNAFKEIGGSKAEALSTVERLEVLYDIYNIGREGTFLAEMKTANGGVIKATDLEKMYSMGITSKDLIAPSGFNFHRDWFMMGSKYCRVMYLMDLPNTLSDKFVSELSSTNCNLIISINLETVRQDKAVKLVKHQMLNINSNMQVAQQTASKNGYSMDLVPQDLKQAQEEANDLLRNLTGRNQKMFMMTFTVLVFGDDYDELQTNTEILISTGRKYLCNLKKLNYQQEDGLNATLPYCFNRLTIKRTLTTDSTIIFSPFDTQELLQPKGMYYGQNATSHNLIIFNRNSSQNGNGWILGTPGSGKSFSAKREMANVFLNTNDDILIIDPEREYSPLVKAFGGSIVRIAPGSKYHLNPLDMDKDYGDDDDPIVLKSDFMLSLCESVIGGRYGLTPSQIAIIDRCVNLVYQEMVSNEYDESKTPTLLDFEYVLEAQPEREAKELALAFEIYTKGSLDVFAHKSNVDINNRFVVYDIKDIGSNIRNMAYLVVLDNVWNRVISNRRKGKRTWIYLDEIYILLDRDESINYVRQIFSRGRKWGALTTGITQNVEVLLQSSVVTTMLSNSAFIQLLNQAPVDRDILAGLLRISPNQVSFINDAPPGQGVLYVQAKGIIPFRDNFSKQLAPQLYSVMTSKPDEMLEEFR